MSALHDVNLTEHTIERPLSEIIRERRATPHFDSSPVLDEDLEKILDAGLAAPSGFNLQPWRFVVIRDPERRKKLREAAMGQPRVEEAPVILVACGDPQAWKNGDLELMVKTGNRHGMPETGNEHARQAVAGLLDGHGGTAAGISGDVNLWVNRHTMIAFTTIMWMAEALGYDTAPMEGFWEDKVRTLLGIPEHVRVVAMLAIGHRKGPDKLYGGRFDRAHLTFGERWGQPIEL
jgi:nitroreductase